MNHENPYQDSLSDIVSLPEYFECEKNHCRTRIQVCLGRRKANSERRGFESYPFGECLDCGQGEENGKFEGSLLNEAKPRRGNGERNLDCSFYGECLSLVSKRNWQSWKCDECPVYREGKGDMHLEAVSKENTRICEDCQERKTIRPSSPFCARCMGKKGNENRKPGRKERKKGPAKGKTTGECQRPDKGEIVSPGLDLEVLVSFQRFPDVLEGLKALAEREIRPLNLQVIYLLKKALKQESANESGGI